MFRPKVQQRLTQLNHHDRQSWEKTLYSYQCKLGSSHLSVQVAMGQILGKRTPPATETPITTPITNPFNQYAYGANDTLITDYPLAKVGTDTSSPPTFFICCAESMSRMTPAQCRSA